MKHLKKRHVALIASAALVLLILLAALIFFLTTKGSTYEEDGITRNSRIHMTNVRLEGNKICYTIENDTCRRIGIGSAALVEKKVNGEWQISDLSFPKTMDVWQVKPFSKADRSFELNILVEDYAGEYRLSEKGAVGYLTITEEMAAALTDYKIYHADGIRQSELLYIDNMRFDAGKIHFTLHNDLERSCSVLQNGVVQKKVNGEWQYYKLAYGKNQKGVTVSSHCDTEYYFEMDTTLTGIAGEYRLILCGYGYGPVIKTDENGERQLEFNEESTYIVGEFTIKDEIPSPTPEIYY